MPVRYNPDRGWECTDCGTWLSEAAAKKHRCTPKSTDTSDMDSTLGAALIDMALDGVSDAFDMPDASTPVDPDPPDFGGGGGFSGGGGGSDW